MICILKNNLLFAYDELFYTTLIATFKKLRKYTNS